MVERAGYIIGAFNLKNYALGNVSTLSLYKGRQVEVGEGGVVPIGTHQAIGRFSSNRGTTCTSEVGIAQPTGRSQGELPLVNIKCTDCEFQPN